MTHNEYLEHRNQPCTEADFQKRYNLSMEHGRKAAAKVLKTYKHENPTCNVTYDRSFDEEILTAIFKMAGKNYRLFMLLVENEPCYCLPLHMWLDNIYKRMELEDKGGNK